MKRTGAGRSVGVTLLWRHPQDLRQAVDNWRGIRPVAKEFPSFNGKILGIQNRHRRANGQKCPEFLGFLPPTSLGFAKELGIIWELACSQEAMVSRSNRPMGGKRRYTECELSSTHQFRY
jgi:hypothetical protein